ncbi:MAG: histidine phosphatase family protein [Ruminococcaceae bacterium]|nr:histidine phosphatase family protein [Oscillospiraceae bacterium]
MLLFYVRHGDPIYNPDSLTPKGEEQARALAPRLAKYGLDEIYVSSSNRAQQTAKPTCEALGLTPTVLDWCKEHYAYRDFSVVDDQGHRHWLFQDEKLLPLLTSSAVQGLGREWYRHEAFASGSCERGLARVQTETDRFMASLGYRHCAEEGHYKVEKENTGRVALFAHQGFGLIFLSCLLDIPFPMICSHFDMGHSGVTVIELENLNGISIPKVLQLSNDSHLYREGLPTDYQNRIWI